MTWVFKAVVATAMLLSAASPASAGISCAVSHTAGSAAAMNFLTYDPLTAATASITVTINCWVAPPGGGSTNWIMTLSNGSGTCLGATGRKMSRQSAPPAAALGYNIFQGALSVEWGNLGCGTYPQGTLQVNPGSRPTDETSQTLRGVIPANQFVPDGIYSETLQLTISY
jgi:spore coat protein U-like protein